MVLLCQLLTTFSIRYHFHQLLGIKKLSKRVNNKTKYRVCRWFRRWRRRIFFDPLNTRYNCIFENFVIFSNFEKNLCFQHMQNPSERDFWRNLKTVLIIKISLPCQILTKFCLRCHFQPLLRIKKWSNQSITKKYSVWGLFGAEGARIFDPLSNRYDGILKILSCSGFSKNPAFNLFKARLKVVVMRKSSTIRFVKQTYSPF